MIIKSYKTHKIKSGDDLHKILDDYLPPLEEKSIVIVTSKIISLCQERVIKNDGTVDKKDLIIKEADWYFEDPNLTRFGLVIPTIKNNVLIANAGIDESNANGDFILWPKNLEQTTKNIWDYLRTKHTVNELGVLVTDSRLTPMRFGLTGIGISWCGFEPLKDYRGKKDIYDKELKMSQLSFLDGLAAAAGVAMGEGNEQTPLATISDIPSIVFQNQPPTDEEINNLQIEKEDDLYGKMLNFVDWKKGGT